MSDEDWRREEYKALRAEILANLDYQKSLVVFGTSALAVGFGVIFHKDVTDCRDMVVLVVQFLSLAFWYSWDNLAKHTELIGTYICLNLEKTSVLSWELFQRRWSTSLASTSVPAGPVLPLKSWRSLLAGAGGAAPFILSAATCVFLLLSDFHPWTVWPEGSGDRRTVFQCVSGGSFALMCVVAALNFYRKLPSVLDHEVGTRLSACREFRDGTQKKPDKWYLGARQTSKKPAERDNDPTG